jgi:hypothetical protein
MGCMLPREKRYKTIMLCINNFGNDMRVDGVGDWSSLSIFIGLIALKGIHRHWITIQSSSSLILFVRLLTVDCLIFVGVVVPGSFRCCKFLFSH